MKRQMDELTDRVELLEDDVVALKTWARDFSEWSKGARGRAPSEAPAGDTSVVTDARAATPTHRAHNELPLPAEAQSSARNRESEVRLVGTWFARVGALVLLLGVAFAFAYAVERNLIGPGVRIATGVVAGILMLVAGERTRRREWSGLAQALSASGLGILYITVWASYHLYGLPHVAAFALLGVITVAGVLVALRHDSQALAVLVIIGGFLNPLLIEDWTSAAPVFGYILVLDAGVLALGVVRRWRGLEWLALIGSWLFVAYVGLGTGFDGSPYLTPRLFATAFWALFLVHSFVAELSSRRETRPGDQGFAVSNALAYFGVSMVLLDIGDAPWRAAFTLGLAFSYGVLGVIARMLNRAALSLAMFGAAVVFVTLVIPVELRESWVAIAWAVEGVALIWLGRRSGSRSATIAGGGLLGMSVFVSLILTFAFGENYVPARLLVSIESFTLVVQIAALYVAGWLLSGSERDRKAAGVAVVTANLVSVAWLTLEAIGFFRALHPPTGGFFGVVLPDILDDQALQLTISTIWAMYAAAAMVVGVAYRARLLRLLAVGLFGATLLKVLFKDVWFLDPLFRTVVLIGLGILLLLASLLYNRFRELILGTEQSPDANAGPKAVPGDRSR